MRPPFFRQPALAAVVGALLLPLAVAANQQQASFAVAVTLHRVIKPLSAAELCSQGHPLQSLGATIQVECPKPAPPQQERTEGTRQPEPAEAPQGRPEVIVVF